MAMIARPSPPTDPEALSFHECCRWVLRDCRDHYAKLYANEGLSKFTKESQRLYCLYLLNQTDGRWRGETARVVTRALIRLSATPTTTSQEK